MTEQKRIYRTAEGRHVYEGDPDAEVLAYGLGDDVPAEVHKELDSGGNDGGKRRPGRPPGAKNRTQHEDK